MLKLAREREELRVVDDQIGAPTWCRAIAQGTARILKLRFLRDAEKAHRDGNGVFHLTAGDRTSWYGFASEIIAQTQATRQRSPKMIAILAKDYPSAAKRPENSVLSNDKLFATFGFKLDPWQAGLRAALAGYAG